MDLKLRSIAWVGKNISHKFETVCQQVDNIVSQEAVKYVENQVQTVGGSVKKLCSDVVHDLLPPVADPMKHDIEEASTKRYTATGACINSIVAAPVEESYMDTAIKQSCITNDTIDPVQQVDHSHTFENRDLLLVDQQKDGNFVNDISETGVEENAVKDVSPTSEVPGLMSKVESGSSGASLLSESDVQNHAASCDLVADDTPTTSVSGEECQSTQNMEKLCDSVEMESPSVSDASNAFTSCEMAFSVISREEKVLEMGLLTSCDSRIIESKSLHGNSPDNISSETVIHNDPVERVECVSSSITASSSTSSAIVSHKGRQGSVEPFASNTPPSLDSVEEDSSKTDFKVSPSGLSENTDKFSESVPTEGTTSSDIGHSDDFIDDLSYSAMETIELGDKVKLDDSSDMVDDRALYAVSYRTQKLRSFKKRIQDAFTSKKRLTKEYEQLAIWFGDTYMGPSQIRPETQTSAISSPMYSESISTDRICDSEWELL